MFQIQRKNKTHICVIIYYISNSKVNILKLKIKSDFLCDL